MHFENKRAKPKGGRYLVCSAAKQGFECAKVRWPYDEFEASFLGFVRELDISAVFTSSAEDVRRLSLDNEIEALKGETVSIRQQQDKLLELLEMGDLKLVHNKLSDLEQKLARLSATLAEKDRERSALQAQLRQQSESREQLKTLIAQLQDESSQDLYRLRSQVASRIRALVEVIFVAPSGSVPFVYGKIDLERAKGKPDRTLLRQLQQSLNRKGTKQRYFSVRFKDGSVRVVVPSDNDPLKLNVQACGPNENEIAILDKLGRRVQKMGPSAELGDLKLASAK